MKTPNLEKLAHRCTLNRKETMTITAQEARAIASEYMHMLEYINKLQDTVIDLQKAQNAVVEVELGGGDF